ncbi:MULTISPECIES: hypothetical protein [unclassified Pseudomonas]|uniref:hypothetical protein n=1 Tax=unclassified Pseudomonas TaxID=196821 RepID=UPI000BA43CEF|nr:MULTISPECIES: hypothetical protein [unclassified Pseudomonas]
MKLLNVLFMTAMAITSSSVFAEGGAERSQEYLKQFKLSQAQVHGSASGADVQSTAEAGSQDLQKQVTKSEG